MTRSPSQFGTWCLAASMWFLVALLAESVPAATVTAQWLPADVKFYVSILDYPQAKPLFDKTGIGGLLNSEAMQPFLKDLPGQLRNRARGNWLGLMWVELGVDWSQFAKVPSGEVAWAVFDINDLPAAVLMADVTGKQAEVQRLLGEIEAAMSKQGVSATQQEVDGTMLTLYQLPERGSLEATTLVHFVRNDTFVATQHAELARRMVSRVGVEQRDNLAGLGPYQYVMRECRAAAGEEPHVLAFTVPFDCLELMAEVAKKKKVEVERAPEIYRSQGFDALSAIGAMVLIGSQETDFRFLASLYAPKPWSQSMQMVDLGNGTLGLEQWIDSGASGCSVLNLHAASVYGNLGPFFDEVVANGAEGTWGDILGALRDDPDGPRLDLNKEVLTFLTGPAIVMEGEELPVNPESPEVVLAIKSSNEPALRAGIKKAMQGDPLILNKDVGDTTCYYSVSQDNADELLWIMCVAHGFLFMANDFDILTRILQQSERSPLAKDSDFQQAQASWTKEMNADSSTLAFYQLDRWVQVRWDLLRSGQQVASRKTLSGMVNSFLGGEPLEEEKPELDGSKLPLFEQVRKYFGPLDAAVETVEHGWLVVGHIRS